MKSSLPFLLARARQPRYLPRTTGPVPPPRRARAACAAWCSWKASPHGRWHPPRSTAAHVRTYTGGCACSGFNLLRTRTRARGQDPLAMTPLPPHICPCTACPSACRARPPVAPRRGCVNTKIGERGSSSVLFRYTPENGITLLPSRHRGSTPRRD
jgi:hypothetical protein